MDFWMFTWGEGCMIQRVTKTIVPIYIILHLSDLFFFEISFSPSFFLDYVIFLGGSGVGG